MEGVKFNEPESYSGSYAQDSTSSSKMTRFLIEKGIAKDRKTAEAILLFLAILLIVLAIIIPNMLIDKPVKQLYKTPQDEPGYLPPR